MVEFVFLDLDETILDFKKAEQIAICKTFCTCGIELTDELLERYHQINLWHWQQLEKGNLNRDQVLVNRFAALFLELGIEWDARVCSDIYNENLAIGHYFLPGAEEAVEELAKKYRLFLASNGQASVQKGRMTSANLYRFFEKCFVSEELGAYKPSAEFFRLAYAQIPDFAPERAIMVGDSLTSDIQGGKNGGIRTCWVNPKGKPCGSVQPDFEIQSICQLPALLERL